MLVSRSVLAVLALCGVIVVLAAAPPPAAAIDPIGTVCTITGWLNGLAGKACGAGKKLISGVTKVVGHSSGATHAASLVGLTAFGAWVLLGARSVLGNTAGVISRSTRPQLQSTWFSSTYWRMAGIAALLTLPFLFAACVQAIIRSDVALLARAALIYLPLSLLVVSVAAPITMLLLAATDEMCSLISAAAGSAGTHGLTQDASILGKLGNLAASSFVTFVVGVLTVIGGVVLWIEMLMREAAVYIVVLMLPLAFAALVWPARRIWAVRAVEVLVALIISKFAVVAVLTLGGAAVEQTSWFRGDTSALIGGTVLVLLAAFAPWAIIRLVPLAELASGAAGSLRDEWARVAQAHQTGHAAIELAGRTLPGFAEGDPSGEPDDAVEAARGEVERLGALSGRAQAPMRPVLARSAAGADGVETSPAEAGSTDDVLGPEESSPSMDGEHQSADFAAGSSAGQLAGADPDRSPFPSETLPPITLGPEADFSRGSFLDPPGGELGPAPPPPTLEGSPAEPAGNPGGLPGPGDSDASIPPADVVEPAPPPQEPEDGPL